MKKIIVAGCGIGGLVAAINLAAKGFDITVYESRDRKDLGHDWCDTVYKPSFGESGRELPSEDNFTPYRVMCCRGPSKRVKIVAKRGDDVFRDVAYIDRKVLIQHLITCAEKAGVEFIFGAKVIAPVTENSFVIGLKILKDGNEITVKADLVIDAAGMDSPVRKNLPISFGIQNEIDRKDALYTYRVYFDKTSDELTDPRYNAYFFHCSRRSIEWVITEDKHIDILISGFGSLTRKEIEESLKDFRKDYPYIGNKILRGGTTAKIPLRKSLPMFIANGYAAVGDSAIMIEPLSGSGIRMSFYGGKILADTVFEAKCERFSVDKLWKYQYRYFKENGEALAKVDIIKNILADINADDMDYLFENGILGAKEFADAGETKYSAEELLSKAKAIIKRPALLKPLSKAGLSIVNLKKSSKLMPEEYDKAKVTRWVEQYKKI